MMGSTPNLKLLDESLKITQNPRIDNLDTARQRGFMESGEEAFDQHHLELLAYYRKAYEHYMLVTLRLDKIDKNIEGSKLGFFPTPDDDKTGFEKDTMLNLKHLYLMNDIHIERLSDADLVILEDLHAKNGATITKEALDFVERTYPVLISRSTPENPIEDGSYILIDPAGSGVQPDSLLIAFTNPELFDEDGEMVEGDKWPERFEYLKNYLPVLQQELAGMVSVPITLLIVDELGSIWYILDDSGVVIDHADFSDF